MGKEIGCCGQSIRLLFIIINIGFVVIGLALLGLGIYLVIEGENYEFVTQNEYASAAPILIVCGAVSAVIAIIGVIGGIGLWWPVLMIYIIFMMIVVILEIIAGALGFVFRDQVADHFSESLNATIFDYRVANSTDLREDVNTFVDYVQNEFSCCGLTSPDNWLDTPYYLETRVFPDSCLCDGNNNTCITIGSSRVYREACNSSLFDFIETNAAIIGGVGLAIGLIEIIGIVFGIILCGCIIAAKRNDEKSWAL